MPSTHTCLHYHLVFSTKNREALIEAQWIERFHSYLGGLVKGLHGIPGGVGGIHDHVHLLVGLGPTHRLSDFMRELKKSSSMWVRDEIGQRSFTWQEGYGAFTVSPNAREAVRRYIANQEEHHRERSFREELVLLLEKAGVDYNPAYLD